MVQAMIGDPAGRMPRPVEHRPEDQKLLDDRVCLERLMREHAVIANRCAKPAKCCEEQRHTKDLQAWERKKDQTSNGKNVNQDQVGENAFFPVNRLPEWTVPRLRRLLRQANFHVFSDDLRRLKALAPWPAERIDSSQNNIVCPRVVGNSEKKVWKW